MDAQHQDVEYSIMNYASYIGATQQVAGQEAPGSCPQTYMMYDIAALQLLYGANFSNVGTNQTYTWDPITGAEFINGHLQWVPLQNSGSGKIFETVWTAGANSTYDLSNFDNDCQLDMRPGGFMMFSPNQLADLGALGPDGPGKHMAQGNVYNALVPSLIDNTDNLAPPDTRAEIDNIITGNGNDVVHGNDVYNTIRLGNGNDHVILGPGGGDVRPGTGSDIIEGSNTPNATLRNVLDYSGDSSGIEVNLVLDGLNLGDGGVRKGPGPNFDGFSDIQMFLGGAGNDTFNAVADHVSYYFDGGGGTNTLSYSDDATAVTINVSGHFVLKGSATDYFLNIQNFVGGPGGANCVSSLEGSFTFTCAVSATNTLDYSWDTLPIIVNVAGNRVAKELADSSFLFDQFSNVQGFTGGSGNDTFIGSHGNYTFDGGGGNNTLDESSEDSTVVDLQTGQVRKGFFNALDGVDTVTNIQNFIGGHVTNTLIAGPGSHSFDGNAQATFGAQAIFHGPRSEYAITLSIDASGTLHSHIVDQGAAGDGTLDLVHVRYLQFSDVTIEPAKTPPSSRCGPDRRKFWLVGHYRCRAWRPGQRHGPDHG
jgi:serralysin